MASTSETGHAKNVANFVSLTDFVMGFGTSYNPSKTILKLPQLNALITLSQSRLSDVITKNTLYNNAVNERSIEFQTISSLSSRIFNALEVTDAAPQKIKNAKTLLRKIQGKRATPIEEKPVSSDQSAPKTISSSQRSFDLIIEHFEGLIAIIQTEPSYAPNENELKVTTLNAKLTALKLKNKAVVSAYTNVSNARIARNKTLYDENTGLTDVAAQIKKYIKSVFKATSPEFEQIKGISFKKVK